MAQVEHVCIRKCHHTKGKTGPDGRGPVYTLYEEGDPEWFDPEVDVIPGHFVPVRQYEGPPEHNAEAFQLDLKRHGFRAPIDRDKLIELARNNQAKIDAAFSDGEGAADLTTQRFSPVDSAKARMAVEEEASRRKK